METLTKAHETCFCWIVDCFRWIAIVYIPCPHIENTNLTFWIQQTQKWKYPWCLQSTTVLWSTRFAWYSPLSICQDCRDRRPIIIFDARCFNRFRVRMEKPLRTSKWKVAFDTPIRKKEDLIVCAFQHLHTKICISLVEMLLLWIEYRRKIHLSGFPLSITFLSIKWWWCQLYGFVESHRYSRIRNRLSFASWNVASNRFSSSDLGINIDGKKPLYLKGRHSKHSWLICAARPMLTLLNPAIRKVEIAG